MISKVWIILLIIKFFSYHMLYALPGCGRSESSLRIIGGEPARPLSWPWMAAISTYKLHNKTVQTCAGTLIDKDFVLTAAHCIFGRKNASIYLGKYNITDWNETTQVYRFSDKLITHENFIYTKGENDIALIKLNESLDFSGEHKHLQPICLTKINYTIETDKCVSIGWGSVSVNQTDETSIEPDLLLQVEIPIMNITYCKDSMLFNDTKINSRKYNPQKMICAGRDWGNVSTCHGDSGGPLMCPLTSGTWIQYGVVSYGYKCISTSLFTRVSYYYDWIHSTMKLNA